jgi:hypothetical protein
LLESDLIQSFGTEKARTEEENMAGDGNGRAELPRIAVIGAGIFARTQYIPRLREIAHLVVLKSIWSRTQVCDNPHPISTFRLICRFLAPKTGSINPSAVDMQQCKSL